MGFQIFFDIHIFFLMLIYSIPKDLEKYIKILCK